MRTEFHNGRTSRAECGVWAAAGALTPALAGQRVRLLPGAGRRWVRVLRGAGRPVSDWPHEPHSGERGFESAIYGVNVTPAAFATRGGDILTPPPVAKVTPEAVRAVVGPG